MINDYTNQMSKHKKKQNKNTPKKKNIRVSQHIRRRRIVTWIKQAEQDIKIR